MRFEARKFDTVLAWRQILLYNQAEKQLYRDSTVGSTLLRFVNNLAATAEVGTGWGIKNPLAGNILIIQAGYMLILGFFNTVLEF